MKQDIVYGSDDSGRLWRAYPKPDQFEQTVLEVAYVDNSDIRPEYGLWAIMSNADMDDITDKERILWHNQMIEV